MKLFNQISKRRILLLVLIVFSFLYLIYINTTFGIYNDVNKKVKFSNLEILSVKLFRQKVSVSFYDSKQRVIESDTYTNGSVTNKINYYYDSSDRLILSLKYTSHKLSLQSITKYKYDTTGNLLEEINYEVNKKTNDNSISHIQINSYDIRGNCIQVVNKHYVATSLLVNLRDSVTIDTNKYIYDNNNKLVESTNAHNNLISHQYYKDVHYEIDQVTRDTIEYKLNNKKEVISEIKKNGQIINSSFFSFDGDGNLVKTIRKYENERIFTYEYDLQNRLIKEYLLGKFLGIFNKTYSYVYVIEKSK